VRLDLEESMAIMRRDKVGCVGRKGGDLSRLLGLINYLKTSANKNVEKVWRRKGHEAFLGSGGIVAGSYTRFR
jgi:hypothetical protein